MADAVFLCKEDPDAVSCCIEWNKHSLETVRNGMMYPEDATKRNR